MMIVPQRFLRGRGLLIAGLAALMAGLIAACGGGDDPTATPPTGPVDPTPTATAPVLPAWEVDWNETLEKAKQEGVVVVQVARQSYREGIELAMLQQFPDIDIEAQVGRGAEERVVREYAAGIHAVDVSFGGASSAKQILIAAGVAGNTRAQLIRPDVIDDENWIGVFDDYWCDDLDGKIHIFCWWATRGAVTSFLNTNRADPQTFTLEDLFKPENEGQWCMFTPLTRGSGRAWLTEIMLVEGKDFIRRLLQTQPFFSEDDRAMAGQIVNDEFIYCAGVPPISDFHKEGVGLHVISFPLAAPSIHADFLGRVAATCCGTGTGETANISGGIYTRGIGGATMHDDPPDPNAAKILLNWMGGEQGARDYLMGSGQYDRHCSARVDVQDICQSAEGLRMEPNTPFLDFITSSTLWTRDEADVIAQEVLGGR